MYIYKMKPLLVSNNNTTTLVTHWGYTIQLCNINYYSI
eukprot:UN06365